MGYGSFAYSSLVNTPGSIAGRFCSMPASLWLLHVSHVTLANVALHFVGDSYPVIPAVIPRPADLVSQCGEYSVGSRVVEVFSLTKEREVFGYSGERKNDRISKKYQESYGIPMISKSKEK